MSTNTPESPITVTVDHDPRGVSVGVWQGSHCVYSGAHPLPAAPGASTAGNPQPARDWELTCNECDGSGHVYVKHQVAERKTDVQEFKEECECCEGRGFVFAFQDIPGIEEYVKACRPAAGVSTVEQDERSATHDITQRVLTDDEINTAIDWPAANTTMRAENDRAMAREVEAAVLRKLSKLRAPVAHQDERAAFDHWFDTAQGNAGPWSAWQARAALASAPVAGEAQQPVAVVRDNPEDYGTVIDAAIRALKQPQADKDGAEPHLPDGSYFPDVSPEGPWFDSDDVRAAVLADRQQRARDTVGAAPAERAEFETWAEGAGLIVKSHGLMSINHKCDAAWEAWKARAVLASAPVAGEAQESIEQMAVNRYRPVPDGKFSYKVVAGDGSRSLYTGTKDSCLRVAAKLTEAFLDGAFVASYAALNVERAGQPYQPSNGTEG